MELGKVSWKRWPWVGFGKMNGNAPGRQGAFHILKSECVTPGVQRKGKDQFLLPCRIAAHDRLSLSGSHNTQLAHGELKPLPFLHCFATSTFIIRASESSFFYQETKANPELLHLSLFDRWSLVLETAALSVASSVWEHIHPCQFSPLFLSHILFRDDVSQALLEAEITFLQVLQRVRCSFYPAVVQCSLNPIKGKETKIMFAKIKLKPSLMESQLSTPIWAACQECF